MHMRFYDYLCKTPVAFLAVISKINMNEKKKLYQKLIKSFKQIFWSIFGNIHPPPPKKKTPILCGMTKI